MLKRTRNLPTSFILVMGVLLLVVLLLGWLLLEQDRRLQQERSRERISAAAERLAAQIEQRLSVLRDGIIQMAVSYPDGNAAVEDVIALQPQPFIGILVKDTDLSVFPRSALHYVPTSFSVTRSVQPWEEATRLEFEVRDLPAALQRLQPMTVDELDWIRAGALARQARVLRRLGKVDEALSTYAQLATMQGVYVESIPAPWLALLASISIHESRDDPEALRISLESLLEELHRGGYWVSKSTYQFYRESAEPLRLTHLPEADPLPATWPASEAIAELAAKYTEWRNGLGAADGMRIHDAGGDRLLLLWRNLQEGLVGGALPVKSMVSRGMRQLTEEFDRRGIGWRVTSTAGQEITRSGQDRWGEISESVLLNAMGATLLIDTFATPSLRTEPEDRMRRSMLLAGLSLVFLVILAGTYFTARALRREAEVANLQSEFISAVSHEFRTPLTSIRQVTEMLDSGRVLETKRQQEYFNILHWEALRLQRMVEDLLDFGRLEADARPYRPERFNLSRFLQELATEFAIERQLDADSLRLHLEPGISLTMDRESLGRAVWNLLDNAMKYSTGAPDITMTLAREDGQLKLEVADRGVGISETDQQRVFDKFVRGSAAEKTRAKGTGLGLAMVKKIIEDQGGAIKAGSRAGDGARFIIILPDMEEA